MPDNLASRLRRALIMSGMPDPTMPIGERQRYYQVPGVSIAVAADGVVSTETYGDAASGRRLTPTTLFQAGSISKPLTAVAVMRLVDKGELELDEDINLKLRSWQVPAHSFSEPVTLRRLLSHSAGVSVTGFPGYMRGAPLPTTLDVLEGRPPANTAPVRVFARPGGAVKYSGGGLTIVQQLIQDVTNENFANALDHLVLEPFGMSHSTFAQPLPVDLVADASVGHTSHGVSVTGGHHVYPEQAAAGLWSTPSDLVRFASALQKAWSGDETLLSQSAVRELFTLQQGNYGLGFRLEQAQGETWFWHTGGAEGFRAHLRGALTRELAVAVMTNGESGAALQSEVLEAVYERTGRMTQDRPVKTVINLDPAPCVGAYVYSFEAFFHKLELAAKDGMLTATSPTLWQGERTWLPESATRFFDPDGNTSISMAWDDVARVQGLSWGGYEFVKVQ